jgi:lipid-A-disaccharide synthase
MPPKVFIIAGEESADHHGAALVRALRELAPDVEVKGYGGHRLVAAGADVRPDLVNNAVVGFSAVLPRLNYFRKKLNEAESWVRDWKPDVVIPIDYPGFNVRIARRVRKNGARVLYYVSPQVWAWWRSRIKGIKRAVDKMLVLFPFEEDLYLDQGIRVEYVGHPLFDYISSETPDPGYRASIGVGPGEPLVALLPGSRDKSMAFLLPLVLEIAKRIKAARPETRFVLPCGRTAYVAWAKQEVAARGLDVAVTDGRAHDAMRNARFAVATSGTTTLECLFFELPMVIVYRVGPVLYLGSKTLLATKYIGLANIIAGREVVPEFLDWRDRPDDIAKAALELYDEGPPRVQCLADLKEAKAKLGQAGASRRAAEAALAIIREKRRRASGNGNTP